MMVRLLNQGFSIGAEGHHQNVTWYKEGTRIKIKSVSCSCPHFTFNADSWEEGGDLCWHLKSALTLFQKKLKHGSQ